MSFNGMRSLTESDPSIITGVMVPDRSGTSGSPTGPGDASFGQNDFLLRDSTKLVLIKTVENLVPRPTLFRL